VRFGTWNVRSLYRAGSFTAAGRVLATYKLDLLGVQVDSWDKGGTISEGDYNFSYRKETKIINFNKIFWTSPKNISSQESRVC